MGISMTGDRHYSDRLCSNRRYSDIPQSGRPSTSLAHLGLCRSSEIGKIGGGRGVACIETTGLMQEPRGAGPGEVSRWGRGPWGAPSSGKVTTYFQHNYCHSAPDFQNLVHRLSNRYCPWAYSTAVSHPTFRLCVDCRNSVCRNRVCRNSVVYP